MGARSSKLLFGQWSAGWLQRGPGTGREGSGWFHGSTLLISLFGGRQCLPRAMECVVFVGFDAGNACDCDRLRGCE